MVSKEEIETKIQTNVPELYQFIVTDISGGCGQSFDIVVVSNSFLGKNKLQRSRLVNKILKDEIAQIHAFSCKCYTEAEWSKIVV
ncbi:FRA2 (YGL220W) [Zygosaccharomyces parabailii]|nr:FRA2 (YGL220W) [Zygosaccharomyces parabailii]AQZ16840.1 FRA2 (YGL220W) [Zygosaccharomyces parabailii]SJM87038.1 related to Fe repressor of activation 2 [Zygosaccharomyces bailii]